MNPDKRQPDYINIIYSYSNYLTDNNIIEYIEIALLFVRYIIR